MKKTKESDWKRFRAMLDELREKYLKGKNIELAKAAYKSKQNSHRTVLEQKISCSFMSKNGMY